MEECSSMLEHRARHITVSLVHWELYIRSSHGCFRKDNRVLSHPVASVPRQFCQVSVR